MLRNYLLIIWRSFYRHKSFSAIQITGLAIGMAACLLILQYVRFERSYEDTHIHKDRIYRIARYFENEDVAYAGNVPALGPAMQKNLPEVAAYARLIYPDKVSSAWAFSYTDPSGTIKTFNQDEGFYADQGLLDIFTFVWQAGDPQTALKAPYSLVLTESVAQQYFGSTSAVGKQLSLNGGRDYLVTGVIEDLPPNTHLQFQLLCSFNSLPAEWNLDQEWGWGYYYTYVLLEQDADINILAAKMPQFIDQHFQEDYPSPAAHFQAITDIHLHSNINHEMQANGNAKLVRFLSLIGLIILIIAWINYINLTTSRAIDRAHEVGVRKVLGTTVNHILILLTQRVAILVLIAFLLAIPVTWFSMYNWLSEFAYRIEINPMIFLGAGLTTLAIALLTIGYLAYRAAAGNPIEALRYE